MALLGAWVNPSSGQPPPLPGPFNPTNGAVPEPGNMLIAYVGYIPGIETPGVGDSAGNAYKLAYAAGGVALFYAPLTGTIFNSGSPNPTTFSFSGRTLSVDVFPGVGEFVDATGISGSYTEENQIRNTDRFASGYRNVLAIGAGCWVQAAPTTGSPGDRPFVSGWTAFGIGGTGGLDFATQRPRVSASGVFRQFNAYGCGDFFAEWTIRAGSFGTGGYPSYGAVCALFGTYGSGTCPGYVPPSSLNLGKGPWCLQTREGWYHEAYVDTGSKPGIYYRRSDSPTPPFAVSARITTSTDDAEPRMIAQAGKRLVLLFTRPNGSTPNVYRTTSDDDGATWSPPTLMFAGCKHSTLNVHDKSNRTLYGALRTTTAGRGQLKGALQENGDASPGTEFGMLKSGGAPLIVDDDTFHFAPAREGALRWTLVAKDGGSIVRYYSVDDGRTWTLIA